MKYIQDIWNDLTFSWMYVGEELRKTLISELNTIPLAAPLTGDWEREGSYVKASFAYDFQNDRYFCGDCCVYAYLTDEAKLVYIGSGNSNRPSNMNNRNQIFLDIFGKHNIKVFIIAANVRKDVSLEVEKLCIYLAQLKGWELEANVRGKLTSAEIVCLREKRECRVLNEYQELCSDYPHIVESFNQFNSKIIDCLLSDDDPLGVMREKRDNKWERRHYWEVDGIIYYATRWCELFGVSYSLVKSRMNRGFTLKEALTVPRIDSHDRKAIAKIEIGIDQSAKVLGRLTEQELLDYIIQNKAIVKAAS